jgi:hypothetical protein
MLSSFGVGYSHSIPSGVAIIIFFLPNRYLPPSSNGEKSEGGESIYFLKNQETGSETERGRERNWMDLRELVGSIERGIGELT